MENKVIISSKFKNITFALAGLGLVALIVGFIDNPQRTWANYLLNSYYFLSLGIGATFFMAIQNITQSGWSAMFRRVPEAIGTFVPVGVALLSVVLIFGVHSIYEWSHHDAVANDPLLQHKSPYLNIPFMIVRYVIFAGLWIFMILLLRRFSLLEDIHGGTEYFRKSEFYSKVLIFILAISFTLGTIDWIMSINPHWFSTIFSIKNFVSAFYHGSATIVLIVILLNRFGYFPQLTKYHLHDFSKYVFMLSIMYGYMWYSQYMLIWYANIPEETIYYTKLVHNGWRLPFFLDIIINWAFPFTFLMLNKIAKNKNALLITAIILFIGQWIDLYLQIMPGATGINKIGYIEIGTYLGFLGVFSFFVARSLSKASIVPQNHPYLKESMAHKLH
ncbi:MAG: hypothetical protein U0W24_16190 [Bacteroidales bacterium]